MIDILLYGALATALAIAINKGWHRLQLSRAKHPSLRGHAKISRRVAKQVPFYQYSDEQVLRCDGAGEDTVALRRKSLTDLSNRLSQKFSRANELNASLSPSVSDMQFTEAYRMPFQFRDFGLRHLKCGAFAQASSGVRIQDIDGHWTHDLGGSYGVNLLGYDFYKGCMQRAMDKVKELGPVLGPYHPLIMDNVQALKSISGLDEISFHMSGTEAVMQAVGLARYHTRRQKTVVFCGAYHGWWDGVQPGIGNHRRSSDIYTLNEMNNDTLRVIRSRKDIACVLVNPLQALNPNGSANSDATLINSDRSTNYDHNAYSNWLKQLRKACNESGVVLIFDEIFVGFRLGLRGAQQYFDVNADMVTYGKTLGGGLPVGVLCGKASLMKRYRDDRPVDVCFARGTFNSHPLVMACMYEFLEYAQGPEFSREIENADKLWDARANQLNQLLHTHGLPVKIENMTSIWVVTYTQPSRFNWLFQFYLRLQNLNIGWTGTGRFIFSHNYTDKDFNEVCEKIISAAEEMQRDGWWVDSQLSNKSIKKQVLSEILRHRIKPLESRKAA